MNIRIVPLLAAFIPLFAVHLTYLVAASNGLVDWCFPYLDSCTSISATGRKPPASYLFRATMLPSAVIMMAYWWLNYSWLGELHRRAGSARTAINGWMLALGVLACIGLILYVTVLGEAGDTWAMQRRIGTVLFFSFTYISQLLLLAQLRRLREFYPRLPPILMYALWFLCIALILLGLATVLLDAWDAAFYDSVEDAFEWVLTLLLQSHFLLGYFVWRYAGWDLRVSTG